MPSYTHTTEKYCINCGHPTVHDSLDLICDHIYRPPLEFLIPCRKLYRDADWCIWSIDNKAQSVYVDSSDHNGDMVQIGTGGIVLRKIELIIKSWPLTDTDSLMTYLNQQYNISEQEGTQLFIILKSIHDLILAAGTTWPYSEITFREIDGCAGLRLASLPFLETVDQLGKLPISKILNEIVLHGQWGAKIPQT